MRVASNDQRGRKTEEDVLYEFIFMTQCPHFISIISFSMVRVSILIIFYLFMLLTIYYRAQQNAEF